MSKQSELVGLARTTNLDEVNAAYSAGALSNRNLIINGEFQVSQRGDFSAPTQLPSAVYFVDRWYFDTNNTGSSAAVVNADITELATAVKAVRVVANNTATSYLGIRQKLEYPEKYAGKTYTYSAYVKSNSTNARLTAYFDGSNQIVSSTSHTGGGGWERLSVTFTLSSTPAHTAYFDVFFASSGIAGVAITAGDYFEVTGVQLEVGDTSTPFEHRSYGQELALCQRYYYQVSNDEAGGVSTRYGYGHAISTVIAKIVIPTYTQLRTKPTISYSSVPILSDATVGTTVTAIALEGGTSNSRTVCLSVNVAGGLTPFRPYFLEGGGGTPSVIKIDAEL